MRKIYTLILTILSLYLTGCEDKKANKHSLPLENTTEIFISEDKKLQQEKHKSNLLASQGDTFTLIDTQDTTYKITLIHNDIIFHTLKTPVVVINFFSLTCTACLDQMASLSKLQNKYQNKLSVISVLHGDSQGNSMLKDILQKHHISHFTSHSKDDEGFSKKLYDTLHFNENTPLPLTVIYQNGKYYSHFEGAVPIEMIHHDIQKSMKK